MINFPRLQIKNYFCFILSLYYILPEQKIKPISFQYPRISNKPTK